MMTFMLIAFFKKKYGMKTLNLIMQEFLDILCRQSYICFLMRIILKNKIM